MHEDIEEILLPADISLAKVAELGKIITAD